MEEIWKSIEGYDGLYEVSNFGRVKRLKTKKYRTNQFGGHYYIIPERILKGKRSTRPSNIQRLKYYELRDENGIPKNFTAAQLVGNAFIPNPNNYKILVHIDGNVLNNNVENLKWGLFSHTKHNNSQENYLHLTSTEIRNKLRTKICTPIKCIETGEIFPSQQSAAARFNISFSALNKALTGKRKSKTSGGYHWEYVHN